MCGLAGIMDFSGRIDPVERVRQVAGMTAALRHRGPDAEGHWCDPAAGIALGHRRLSILDLSPAGAQPMHSACGRYVIAFNGEIYNHQSLRRDLEQAGQAIAWRGGSDTETLLAAIAHWGLAPTLRRACGMFALALWDRRSQTLALARDRMGEKPLYLMRLPRTGWAFASELGALRRLPEAPRALDRRAVAAYLAHGYVPDGMCIQEATIKVPPGQVLTLAAGAEPVAQPYETFVDLLNEGLTNRPANGAEARLDGLERTLLTVVDEQMLSDVPLGCFLSGGIDSSLVASLMQAQRARPIHSFSIGFDVPRFNEAPFAAAVARHLGTEHTEFLLTEDDALNEVAGMADIYDEPFADPSQIPTALLCRKARGAVTVALTGDGGDEVFGGYNRHVHGPALLRNIGRIPRSLRRPAAAALRLMAPALVRDDSWLRRVGQRLRLPVTALDRAVGLAPAIDRIRSLEELHRHFLHSFHDSGSILLQRHGTADLDAATPSLPADLAPAEWLMAMDSVTYLPGDILAKVDRAAMAASLETRAPFLDRRVVAAAWALPPEMKIAGGTGKLALRRLLERHVPSELFERPKQGFAIPLDRWLRAGLRGWAEDLMLDQATFDALGLDIDAFGAFWKRHQGGAANHGRLIWTVLCLIQWQRRIAV